MAMIVCPHCGEQVSEKAKKCVHCGEILILEGKRRFEVRDCYFQRDSCLSKLQ